MSKQYKQLSCRDAGVDCDFLVRTESATDAGHHRRHAKRVHGYARSPGNGDRMRGLVKTVAV